MALLDCAVPVPMIMLEPAKVAKDKVAAAAAAAASGKKGGRRGGGAAVAGATKVVGLEWCAEYGSPLLEIATLSPPGGGGRGGKRATPAHLRARFGLMVSREAAAAAAGSSASSDVKRGNIRRVLAEAAAAAGAAAAASAAAPWSTTGVIRVPAGDDFLSYHSHPACMDNSMQLAAALATGASKVTLAPTCLPISNRHGQTQPVFHSLVGTIEHGVVQ